MLQQAGLNKRFAMSVGIAVDPRRRNKSHESVQQNVQRLKEYKAKLIIFPKNENKKLKKGEADVSITKCISLFVFLFPCKKWF